MINYVHCAQPVTFQVREENGTVIETKTVAPDDEGMIDIKLNCPIHGSVESIWGFNRGPLLDTPFLLGDNDMQTKDNGSVGWILHTRPPCTTSPDQEFTYDKRCISIYQFQGSFVYSRKDCRIDEDPRSNLLYSPRYIVMAMNPVVLPGRTTVEKWAPTGYFLSISYYP